MNSYSSAGPYCIVVYSKYVGSKSLNENDEKRIKIIDNAARVS